MFACIKRIHWHSAADSVKLLRVVLFFHDMLFHAVLTAMQPSYKR